MQDKKIKCEIRYINDQSSLQKFYDRNNGRLPVGAIPDLKVGIYFDFSTMKMEMQKDV